MQNMVVDRRAVPLPRPRPKRPWPPAIPAVRRAPNARIASSITWPAAVTTGLEAAQSAFPQHGGLAMCYPGKLEALEGPPNPSIQNISGLPQGLARRPAAGWSCGRL